MDFTTYQRNRAQKIRRAQGKPTARELIEARTLYRQYCLGQIGWDTFVQQTKELKQKHRP